MVGGVVIGLQTDVPTVIAVSLVLFGILLVALLLFLVWSSV